MQWTGLQSNFSKTWLQTHNFLSLLPEVFLLFVHLKLMGKTFSWNTIDHRYGATAFALLRRAPFEPKKSQDEEVANLMVINDCHYSLKSTKQTNEREEEK